MLSLSNWPKSMPKVIIVNIPCRGPHLVLFSIERLQFENEGKSEGSVFMVIRSSLP